MGDEIQATGPRVIAQLVITLLEGPDGKTLTLSFPPDEIMARYLIDKARDTMADHWRTVNAPRVVQGNGGIVTKLRGLHGP